MSEREALRQGLERDRSSVSLGPFGAGVRGQVKDPDVAYRVSSAS